MQVTVSQENNATILTLSGRLDSSSAPQFEEQLTGYLASPTSHLIFDFNDLDYISSAGLRLILNTAKAYRQGPFVFMTCSMQDHVLEVFEIAGFDTIITIHNTMAETLSALDRT
ncbi:STAS domain-containing protein [Desulforhopalus singaporensis]|uniref:Anti-sigma factor antagonist n=1 Tax=Desulforhopalus singaporensis TaxID=91360 RepID=A0A1H0N5F3_9BACT|nr:STAS domain-containing protein [Desulforhopalus singaporensis]SDO87944.1 anti-sigma B factor antagonist [Desulforhopalus singaporensis]